MTVTIPKIDSIKRSKNKLYEQHDELFSLQEYIKIAKQTIGYFAHGDLAHQMLSDEDAISFIAERLIDGHCRWREDGGRTLRSWLNQCAIFAVQRYIYMQKNAGKKKISSINNQMFPDGRLTMADTIDSGVLEPYEELFDGPAAKQENIRKEAEDIINSGILTERQKEYMSLRFLDGFSITDIAQKLNVSRQAVDQSINDSLKKLRNKYV